jgi:hypothetical protein
LLGYLGLAPYQTQIGDVVCILFGKDGNFLVGYCYIHGIMDGEALEGVDLKKETRMLEIW